MADFVTLACPTCGGKLQITPDINRFACAHCGNEHLVKRLEGLVALQPLQASLSGLERATNRAAVEMGLRRLKEELASTEARHAAATRTLAAARESLERGRRRTRGALLAGVFTITSAVCCVVSSVVPFYAYSLEQGKNNDALSALSCIGTAMGLLAFLLATLFVLRLFRLPGPGVPSDQARRSAQAAQAEVTAAAALLQAKQAEIETLRAAASRTEG
jgi:hypothetical protein